MSLSRKVSPLGRGNTGVERTQIKSQHTKLTLEKKNLPPLLPGFELATFRSRVRRSANQPSRLCNYMHNDASLAPQWRASDAEIKVPSGENTELKRSPFKAWSRSIYLDIHATLTARDFFLAYFYPSGPFTCIFSKTSPNFFPVLACRIK